jgi:CRISPR-associated protein Cas2
MTDWVVAYDIGDDGRREHIATLLSAWGPRVQLSVFECQIPTETEGRTLRAALRAAIDPHEDQIRIYELTGTNFAGLTTLGARVLEERQDFWIIT